MDGAEFKALWAALKGPEAFDEDESKVKSSCASQLLSEWKSE